MATVRISQFPRDDQGRFPIEIDSEVGGRRFRVRATTAVTLSDDDRRDLHWYLEQYLEETYEPHPQRAAAIERRMADIGEQPFRDARLYAEAALADFRSYGANATDMIAETERLLAAIAEAEARPPAGGG